MPTNDPLPLLRGTLDTLVLKALSWAPMHGFELITWLEERSAGVLELDDSAVYQSLYRLEARGIVAAEWGVTENNRRARFYRPTAKGTALLRAETKRWLQYAKTVNAILTT